MAKVPVIEQCTVSGSSRDRVLVENLADYLARNKNLQFPHRHNFYHFVLFTQGKGRFTIDFDEFEVEPWTMYFMAPGQIHTWSFADDVNGYVVNFDKDLFNTTLLRPDYLGELTFFSPTVRRSAFTVATGLRDEITALLGRLETQTAHLPFVQAALLYLFQLLDLHNDQGATHKASHPYGHTLLLNFLQLIESNYREMRLPKEYAALLHITPNHLNALSKEQLGAPAGEIIRNRIILEAKRLLAIRDYAVAEIAYELNFKDNSYFSKFFKKIEGVSPEEFRKNIQFER